MTLRDPLRVVDDDAEKAPKKTKSAPWDAALLKNKQGAYTECLQNYVSILANHPKFRGRLAYNESTGRVEKVEPILWDDDQMPTGVEASAGPFSDDDETRAAAFVGGYYNIPVRSLGLVRAAIRVAAKRRSYHPVRDWLESLEWDGRARLETSLIRYAGAPDTLYVRAVGRIFAIGAVARIYQPGAKVDTTLILDGTQGKGKSSLLRELAGEQWFLETDMAIGTKDALQDLRGKWIVEFAELDSLSRAEMAKVKAFLTRRIDTYRESYGRQSEDRPRQCVFTGSTNKEQYLRDDSGNRRFLPVAIGRIDLELARREREQYWAEAVARLKRGELWHITPEEKKLLAEFGEQQEDRRETDPWEREIAAWLAKPIVGYDGKGKQRKALYCAVAKHGVSTRDILLHCLKIEPKEQKRADEMRVATILTDILRFTRGPRETVHGLRLRRYLPSPGWSGRSDASDETAENKPDPDSVQPGQPKSSFANKGTKRGETIATGDQKPRSGRSGRTDATPHRRKGSK